MPHAKFRADPLKTVAVHKEQRTDKQTDRHFRFYMYNINQYMPGTRTLIVDL